MVSSLASGTLRLAASLLNGAADKLSTDISNDVLNYTNNDMVDYRLVLADKDSVETNKKCSENIRIEASSKLFYSTRVCDELMYEDNDDEPVCSVVSNDSGLDVIDDIEIAEGEDEETEDDEDDGGNPEGLPEISLDEVSNHCWGNDAWMVIYNKVYDVTDFIQQHPGGDSVMLENIGYDGTMAFHGVGHSRDALEMLDDYLIGILPPSQRINSYIPNTPQSVPGCW
jgi:cytochrome b involved in lipid metabolism